MNKVYIGKIVNTHGVKGEVRIRSNFPFKDKVFIVNNSLIIDDKEYNIRSYRKHKSFDMVTLNEYSNINDILFLVGKKVYFDKDKLLLGDKEILDEDLIKFKVVTSDGKEGKILEIFESAPGNKIIRVMLDKEVLIPYVDEFVSIDKTNNIITINMIGGM